MLDENDWSRSNIGNHFNATLREAAKLWNIFFEHHVSMKMFGRFARPLGYIIQRKPRLDRSNMRLNRGHDEYSKNKAKWSLHCIIWMRESQSPRTPLQTSYIISRATFFIPSVYYCIALFQTKGFHTWYIIGLSGNVLKKFYFEFIMMDMKIRSKINLEAESSWKPKPRDKMIPVGENQRK